MQHPLSSKYVVIFISSFYSQLLVYFIDLLSWFAWLVSLYGPKRSPEFGNFQPFPLCYFNREGGKNLCPIFACPVIYRTKEIWAVCYLTGCGVGVSVRMWERGCLNQSETEYIQIMIPNFRRFHFLFLTESLYQKGSAKDVSEYFRIGKNEVTCCSLPAWCIFFWPPPYYDAAPHFARQVVKGKIAGKYSNAVNHNFFCRNPIPY